MAEPVRITVQGVLEDLQNGYTRCKNDKHYEEGKSIQEKYGINKTQVSQLFKHDKLKGRKVKVVSAPAFILVDEDDAAEETDTPIDNSTDTEKDISGINESNETDTSKEDATEPVEASEDGPSWMG